MKVKPLNNYGFFIRKRRPERSGIKFLGSERKELSTQTSTSTVSMQR
jgi:hypothetical protein